MNKVIHIIMLFAAMAALSCQRQTIPQSFNYKVMPAELGVADAKIAALDGVLQGFIDQQKVS